MPDNITLNGEPAEYGVLLVNLGTPASPTAKDIKPYLRQFLSDPRVVALPRWLWWPVLNGVILPLRSRRIAHNYQAIWMDDGSPLQVYSQRQSAKLKVLLAEHGLPLLVELAMTYGEPSIPRAMAALREQGVNKIVVLPLYPQYSSTTTAAIFDAVANACRGYRQLPEFRWIYQYHRYPAYITALAQQVRRFQLEHGQPDQLIMSFHGIPQRYVTDGDPYARQCEQTAQALADALGLTAQQWQLCYQSRFGRDPWLQPYLDRTLATLPSQGVHSLQVICPGFSVDCLETLEEIALQDREVFLQAGGESYRYIPALNDAAEHISLMTELVAEQLTGW